MRRPGSLGSGFGTPVPYAFIGESRGNNGFDVFVDQNDGYDHESLAWTNGRRDYNSEAYGTHSLSLFPAPLVYVCCCIGIIPTA